MILLFEVAPAKDEDNAKSDPTEKEKARPCLAFFISAGHPAGVKIFGH